MKFLFLFLILSADLEIRDFAHEELWALEFEQCKDTNCLPGELKLEITPVLTEALAQINDTTNKMLNLTFWQTGTPEDVAKYIKMGADLTKTNGSVIEFDYHAQLRILEYALESGRADMVYAVLNNGGSADHVDNGGVTPLMRAASYYDLNLIKQIIAQGGDKTINAVDQFGDNMLNYAEAKRCNTPPEIKQYLLSLLSPTEKLFTRTFWQSATPDDVQKAIDEGADINLERIALGSMSSPRGYAEKFANNKEAVKVLIDAGAKLYDSEIYEGCDFSCSEGFRRCYLK